MNVQDSLEGLARYYDVLMEHVDYNHWAAVALTLGELLPEGFCHLDVACGTGTLIRRLRGEGWRSMGVDLSFAMLRAGRAQMKQRVTAAADMRALPVRGRFHLVTCLFDSLNFLLQGDEVAAAVQGFADALEPGGLAYFDIVTARMVTEHFAGRSWSEKNGKFETVWTNAYDPVTGIADSHIRVNTGPACLIRERIYSERFVRECLKAAGLAVLAAVDADTWRNPTRRTTRIDFVAAKTPARTLGRRFAEIRERVRQFSCR
ncbi:MAG: class I SAM-dependent methyltransferase [Candidatus Hydrogenedentes bacterium]|nr:class I SAM-dependent methyltransferase [Candidatus Hydrogenedentota bacterium]